MKATDARVAAAVEHDQGGRQADAAARLTIRSYRDHDLAKWRELNESWLAEAGFVIEDKDRAVIDRPDAGILQKGGAIFVADLGGAVVGCCALLAMEDGGFELAKMAVAPEARRTGAGRRLLEACQAAAVAAGAHRIYLETSLRLVAARTLYSSFGFVELPPRPSPYARAEVFMEKRLDG